MQYREKLRSKVQKRPGTDILPEYGFEQAWSKIFITRLKLLEHL